MLQPKSRRDGWKPSLRHCMSPQIRLAAVRRPAHWCRLHPEAGCRGRAAAWTAHSGYHFLPLLELIRGQNRLQFRIGVFADGFHLGHAIVAGEILVLPQIAHFLPLIVEDRLDLGFLVIGQVELLRDHIEVRSPAAHAGSRVGRRPAVWRMECWWHPPRANPAGLSVSQPPTANAASSVILVTFISFLFR